MLLLLLLNATQKTPEDVPRGVTGGAVHGETGRLGTTCHVERARLRLPCSQPDTGGARGIRIPRAATKSNIMANMMCVFSQRQGVNDLGSPVRLADHILRQVYQ